MKGKKVIAGRALSLAVRNRAAASTLGSGLRPLSRACVVKNAIPPRRNRLPACI